MFVSIPIGYYTLTVLRLTQPIYSTPYNVCNVSRDEQMSPSDSCAEKVTEEKNVELFHVFRGHRFRDI